MAHLSQNEKTKLTANWFNTVSVACVVVGVLTPLAGVSPSLIAVAGWFLAALALHLLARRVLGRLRE